jgi:16S rRNA processing protein RimM
LTNVSRLFLKNKPYSIRNIRFHKAVILVTLAEIEDRTLAETFAKTIVYIDQTTASQTDQDYAEDILHKTVVTESGRIIGKVRNIIKTPVHDVLEVCDKTGKETLIPWVDQFVREISDTILVDIRNLEEYKDADR